MGKALLFLSLVILAVVAFGTTRTADNPMFWLTSGEHIFQYFRSILSLVLLLQLVTRPPRHIWFRLLAGGVAVTTALWTVAMTYALKMPFLDTFIFLAASISIAIAALERKASAPDVFQFIGSRPA